MIAHKIPTPFCRRCGEPAARCADGSACGRPEEPARFCGACGRRLREIVLFPGATAPSCPVHGTTEPAECAGFDRSDGSDDRPSG